MLRADADADEQVQIGGAAGCADDLVEFVERIEAEGLHAIGEVGFGDRFLGLDRVHETQRRLRQRFRDQPHFAQ